MMHFFEPRSDRSWPSEWSILKIGSRFYAACGHFPSYILFYRTSRGAMLPLRYATPLGGLCAWSVDNPASRNAALWPQTTPNAAMTMAQHHLVFLPSAKEFCTFVYKTFYLFLILFLSVRDGFCEGLRLAAVVVQGCKRVEILLYLSKENNAWIRFTAWH